MANTHHKTRKVFSFTVLFLCALFLTLSSGSGNILVVDQFSNKTSSGGIPEGWKVKEWKGKAVVSVESESENYCVHLKSDGTSFALSKEIEFNIKDYPYIQWRWKVTKLPEGGDVRNKNTDDQAAQLYVNFPKFPALLNARQLGYIWENKTPRGISVTSKKRGKTRYIVLENAEANVGNWIIEIRNVYKDYKDLFGEEPPEVGSVSIMIDSDDNKSTAESFFDYILFSKTHPAE